MGTAIDNLERIARESGIAIGEKRGKRQGKKQGFDNAIQLFIQNNLKEGLAAPHIKDSLSKLFLLTPEQAEAYFLRFAK